MEFGILDLEVVLMSFEDKNNWHLFNNLQIFYIILVSCIMGIALGYWYFSSQDFSYKEASVMTCDYANKLTNIINNQSITLELFENRSVPYTKLDVLNCSRLSGELLS
jgi:hypothetical protein